MDKFTINISLKKEKIEAAHAFFESKATYILYFLLFGMSVFSFMFFLDNGLGLAYNDARSHLDIGRRVVEGLKPGLAQLGSVWLPLPHMLMVPTIWNDWAWHSGFSGALQSMASFIITGLLIYWFLKHLRVGLFGRILGVIIFVANINMLYMQSTAMTELLLLATMTAGVYELVMWSKDDNLLSLVKSSFWIMLSTLVRYDGWFLFLFASVLVIINTFLKKRSFRAAEGTFLFFATLGGLGIILWFLWNQLIFKDALYFIFGPYSARSQQKELEAAGVLATKGDLFFSIKVYAYALFYNSGAFTVLMSIIGAIFFFLDKKISSFVRLSSTALLAPFFFNVLALFLGHSVLFVQGLSGDTWFNARYGLMMVPSIAIFIGYLISRFFSLRTVLVSLLLFTTFFSFANGDAVTIDDARVGSSQKNVSEVSGWLNKNAKDREGFVLISAASHDAIIFSSGLPMKKFIHEGTGAYWTSATTSPDRWARWIVMRTHDNNDQTWKLVSKTPGFSKYIKVESYPFADIYEIKQEFVSDLNTKAVLPKQR